MPHATEPGASEPEDADFDNVMRQLNGPFGEGDVSFDFMTRELDPGEKADDAIDYEDFDDDELPEEEEAAITLPAEGIAATVQEDDAIQGLFDEPDDLFGEQIKDGQLADDGLDDLFGDGTAAEKQEYQMKDLFF